MRFIIAWAALLAVSCSKPLPPPAAQTYSLSWKLKVGESYRLKYASTVERKYEQLPLAPIPGLPDARSVRISGVIEVSVLSEGPPGEYDLRLSFREYSIDGKIAGVPVVLQYKEGQWVREEVGKEIPERDFELGAEIKRLKEFAARVTQRRISPIKPRNDQQEELIEAAPLMFSWPELPRHAIQTGETWTEDLGLGNLRVNLQLRAFVVPNRLASIEEGRAEITSNLKDESKDSKRGNRVTVTRDRAATFDRKSSRFIQMKDEFQILEERGKDPKPEAAFRVSYRIVSLVEIVEK